MRCAKTDKPIEMLSALWTRGRGDFFGGGRSPAMSPFGHLFEFIKATESQKRKRARFVAEGARL